LIDRKQWESRKTDTLRERMKDMDRMFSHPDAIRSDVKRVPGFILKNPTHAQLMEACEDYLDMGFEGAMVKDLDSPYVFKRGKNLLKVKKFFDADLKVVDFYEGKGKHKGRLGGIIVEGKIDGKSYSSKVGSGFDDAIRDEIWMNRKKWMNAVVQVQYQDATKDGSLRFPVFIMRRKDKE
jgi:DNA ligase-1